MHHQDHQETGLQIDVYVCGFENEKKTLNFNAVCK